jgi:hypothetical protein
MPVHKPYPLKKCARKVCSAIVKGWEGVKVVRRVPKCVYDKRRFCSKRCAKRPEPCGWQRDVDEFGESIQWLVAIEGKRPGRRCAWSGCDVLLTRKRVKSGEYESAANFKTRKHCNAAHAALAMRDSGRRKGIVAAMQRRAELHP